MDANLQEIIDNLDEKAPRSRLGPYRDLILELRRRNRTYREILKILADHCQIQVSISTLHDFMYARQRTNLQLKNRQAKYQKLSVVEKAPKFSERINEEIPEIKEVQQRIAALKQRETPTQTNAPRFSYDPSQPLHLQSKAAKNIHDK